MNSWNPRQEILAATQRWYWVMAAFLLGALLGWLVSLIWPAPFRATLDLYVGLNAYRAAQDRYIAEIAQKDFVNLDDFKHWQMSQLNSLVLSDEYLAETLALLRAENPDDWDRFSIPELRALLSVSWRDTGDWHFSAQSEAADQAAQAVVAWTRVVTEKVRTAVEAARQVVLIDSQLSVISQSLVDLENRQQILLTTQSLLADWEAALEETPSEQPLSALDHWRLLSQVAAAADLSTAWQAVLQAAPEPGSLPADYRTWLEQVQALIAAELTLLPEQIAEIQVRQTELGAAYQLAADQSRALSATLEVSANQDEVPQVTQLRPVSTWLLVGGLLGVLVLGLGWLVQITRRTEG